MKKVLEDAYENVKVLTPDKVKEEIVLDGAFFTVARITVDINGRPIVAEGLSKRTGDDEDESNLPEVDEVNLAMGREIALGRARKAMALKLVSGKPWVKIHNPLMG